MSAFSVRLGVAVQQDNDCLFRRSMALLFDYWFDYCVILLLPLTVDCSVTDQLGPLQYFQLINVLFCSSLGTFGFGRFSLALCFLGHEPLFLGRARGDSAQRSSGLVSWFIAR